MGDMTRAEAEKIPVGYEFDLCTNELAVIEEDNPTGGTLHTFTAHRMPGEVSPAVRLAARSRP